MSSLVVPLNKRASERAGHGGPRVRLPAGDNPDNGQGPLSAAHPSDGPTSPAQARPRRRAQRPAKRTASHASKIRRDQEAPEPHAGPESAQLSGNPGRAGQAARRSSRGGSQPAAAASGRHSSRLTRPFKSYTSSPI